MKTIEMSNDIVVDKVVIEIGEDPSDHHTHVTKIIPGDAKEIIICSINRCNSLCNT